MVLVFRSSLSLYSQSCMSFLFTFFVSLVMQCSHPVQVMHPNGYYIWVPCNKCANCRARIVQEWTQRLTDELSYSDFAYFVTLTYSDDALNYVRTEEGEYLMTLSRSDYDKYLHAIRYQADKNLIGLRFFGCGEYGKSTSRPHYHFVFFIKCANGLTYDPLYWHTFFTTPWKYGEVSSVTPVTDNSVFAYICKDMYKNDKRLTDDVRLATFRSMSKRPALGLGWCLDNKDFFQQALRKKDSKVYVPRVYQKHLLLSDEDKQYINELNLKQRIAYEKTKHLTSSDLDIGRDFTNLLAQNSALADLRTNRIKQKKTRF